MHNIEYEYDPSETPSEKDIAVWFAEPPEYFEVLFKVKIKEGWLYIVRENYRTKKPGEK